jgi:hypothetical protein
VYHTDDLGGGAAGGGWNSVGNVTEAASDWLGLKDSSCFWPTAELQCQATSQPLVSRIIFLDSTLQNSKEDRGVIDHLKGLGPSAHMTSGSSLIYLVSSFIPTHMVQIDHLQMCDLGEG